MRIILFLMAFMLALPAQAGTVNVDVEGLVCDFCAQGIEKVFSRKDEISAVKVDLSSKVVTINFKDNQTLSDEIITELITDNGFTVVAINHECAEKVEC